MVSSYVGPRNCPPTGRAADAIHGQLVLLLRFQQGVFGFFSKNAVRGQPQQPLEHLCSRSVCIPGTAPADGRQNEFQVGGAGVLARRGAEPRCFRATGVGVDKCSTAVPVDADAAEPHGLCKDAQGHRVDAAVCRPPVRRHAVTVLTA